MMRKMAVVFASLLGPVSGLPGQGRVAAVSSALDRYIWYYMSAVRSDEFPDLPQRLFGQLDILSYLGL